MSLSLYIYNLFLVSYLVIQSVCQTFVPLFLSQMNSDLHETVSVISDWSPKLIYIVRLCTRACMHAHSQSLKMCRQLGKCGTPQFLSQMNSDFEKKTLYDLQVHNKEAAKQIRVIHAFMYTQHVKTCMHISIISNVF